MSTPAWNRKSRMRNVQTTDATATTLDSLVAPVNQVITLQAVVNGRRTGGTLGTAGDSAGYIVYATVKNVSGTATLVGSVTQAVVSEDQAAWNATIDVNGGTARLRVTGAASNNVNWTGLLEVINSI